ncbi:MAG: hypothetical protein HY717_09940, partial [Planctomycetes bacterium]|nr:hypothetical protein [Planctomycetota bacterium]
MAARDRRAGGNRWLVAGMALFLGSCGMALAPVLGAGPCKQVPLFEPTAVPLTVTKTDPVPGSVADGLLVQAAGEINTVSFELEVTLGEEDLEQVHVGPLLPSSGFPVFLVQESAGAALPVSDGEKLPLEIISPAPGKIRATFFVAGPGGGFAGDAPAPLLILVFTPRSQVSLRIARWEAYSPDGAEITSVFGISSLCLEPVCDFGKTADAFTASMGITQPEVEDRSILEGFPLILQAAGQVQAGDFQVLYDPLKLEFRSLKVKSFFRRAGCGVAVVPPEGPGFLLQGEGDTALGSELLRKPGEVFFGLSAVGLCAPPSPAAGAAEPIVEMEFKIRSGIPRIEDVLTQIEMGPATRLYGTDGAPLHTFFDRTSACYRFPGEICPTEVTCVLTDDCRGAVITWDNARYENVKVFRDGLLLESLGRGIQNAVDPDPGIGGHTYAVAGAVEDFQCNPRSCSIVIPQPLQCPESLTCRLVNLEGARSIQLSWVNNAAYDFLQIEVGGALVPVSPDATEASLPVDLKSPVPLEVALIAGRGDKRCEEARCHLLPFCVQDFTCSTDSSGRVRLDWAGDGPVTLSRLDLFSGETEILADGLEGAISFIDAAPPGELGAQYQVYAFAPGSGELCGFLSCEHQIPEVGRFIRGDANASGFPPDLSDAIYILIWLFIGGVDITCLNAANANAELDIDISDPIFLLRYLFLGDLPPPAPYLSCGLEVGTSGGWGCRSYEPCEVQSRFPRGLTCVLEPAGQRVLAAWTPGSLAAGETGRQFVRLGSRPPVEIGLDAGDFQFDLQPEDFTGEVPVFLIAMIDGLSRVLSCTVDTPVAGECPSGMACALNAARGEIAATWSPGSGLTALKAVKDSGLEMALAPGASSVTLPVEPGDRGRVVEVRLEGARSLGGPCSASCQVEVPRFACPQGLACSLDLSRIVLKASWSAGTDLSSAQLELQKGDGIPALLDPGAASAEIPLAESDFGQRVAVSLKAPEDRCDPLQCSVDVPALPVTCPSGFSCLADARAGVIRASWMAGGNLTALELQKGGEAPYVLPPDAEALSVRLGPGDFGRNVRLTLRGFSGAAAVCESSCAVSVPVPVICPANLSCAADTLQGLILASWTQGSGLDQIEILKDGAPAGMLPGNAASASLPLMPGDFGRTVALTLLGQAGGETVCQADCAAAVPLPVVCPANFTCAADLPQGLI